MSLTQWRDRFHQGDYLELMGQLPDACIDLVGTSPPHNEGRIEAEELRAVEDRAILSAPERQRATGVQVYTDEEAVAADSFCLEGAQRPGTTIAMHICRGNNQSKWYTQGAYEAIAERLFGSLAVDRFLLEYDTERAGTFEPLRHVPGDKLVVLGLVSSKEAALESRDYLLRRIEEVSRCVPVDRLALSPQCGFASTAAGNLLTEDDQCRKLELVAEVAREVWGG